MRVQVSFTNGTRLFGELVTESLNIGDVLNDEREFIEFRRPNGSIALLNKNSVAYVVEAADEL